MRLISIFALLLLLPGLAAVPAVGQYDNGPINGTTDAWTINFGFVVSDTFTVTSSTTIPGLTFGAWLFPGDVLTSVEVSITSAEFGGTIYFDQTVNFTQSGCFANQFGFNVCTEAASFNGPFLNAGTYWLNLQNASVANGDPVYWDENSGVGCGGAGCPSSASENELGTIPSEAFTIGCCVPPPSTPEPSTITLSSGGILAVFGFLGALRRKIF